MKLSIKKVSSGIANGELLVLGVFGQKQDYSFASTRCISDSQKKALLASLKEKQFCAMCADGLLLSSVIQKNSPSVLVIGLGKEEKLSLQKIRLAAGRACAEAKRLKLKTVSFCLNTFKASLLDKEALKAVAEGAVLSSYEFKKYKSKPGAVPSLNEFKIILDSDSNVSSMGKTLEDTQKILEAVFFTKDIANEPANIMTPLHLSKMVKEMARKNNLKVKILGKEEIRRLGMGGLLAVSQGSNYPPQFIILENKVSKPQFSQPIVLVGKGITFDTGGISIKPSNDMDKMKFDMCGAAAVIGAMKAIANLKLPVKVIGLTPICENMPGSKAQRPGDIIKCLNGKTVEVLNTDAEGRLILADALSYAAKFKPKALIDLATLTGACAATFSNLAIGLMGTDEALVARFKKAGDATGERVWELPLWEEYFELIKATYADIQNISKRYAGTITAGMFLKEFADHTKSWAHLDIAGVAYNESGSKPLSPIGATGVGVRLVVEVVKSYL